MWFLIMLGFLMFMASAVFFIRDIIYEILDVSGSAVIQGERWAIMLLFPAFIFFFLASVLYAISEPSATTWRHVAYQIAAFFILALSLRAFGLHHPIQTLLGEPVNESRSLNNSNPSEGTRGQTAIEDTGKENLVAANSITEIAAIMILFVLAELAAFVGHDVNRATHFLGELGKSASQAADRTAQASRSLDIGLKQLEDTTVKISQLRLVASVAMLHPTVLDEAINLVHEWGGRAPAQFIGESARESTVSGLCWRTLLKEYIKEEILDVAPREIEQGIPKSVRPVDSYSITDVSFIATNVGFYAKFLSSLVDNLLQEKKVSDKLCIGIITNVLPAHYWNWPMPDKCWNSYGPIDTYRQSLIKAVDNGSQVDRVLLVFDDPLSEDNGNGQLFDAHNDTFWRHQLLNQMLGSWSILMRSEDQTLKDETLNCSPSFAGENGAIGTQAYADFPGPIKSAATRDYGSLYPMITSSSTTLYNDYVDVPWLATPIIEIYKKLHGKNGGYWKLPLDSASLNLFEGRHDIMFIGLGAGSGEKEGLWAKEAVCDWGMCLMSSMSPTSETMFLTAISGESVIKQYEWCYERLHRKVNWGANKLNSRT